MWVKEKTLWLEVQTGAGSAYWHSHPCIKHSIERPEQIQTLPAGREESKILNQPVRAPDLIPDGCEPPRGCREPNSGPLEGQAMLLTSEPSLQPLHQEEENQIQGWPVQRPCPRNQVKTKPDFNLEKQVFQPQLSQYCFRNLLITTLRVVPGSCPPAPPLDFWNL